MTTQEQLEKIIESKQGKLSGLSPYIIEQEIKELASTILSAIRIDENKLRELWGVVYTQEPFKNRYLDSGLGNAYVNLIASYAQEIIKFEEE